MFSVDDLRINLLDKLYFINNDVKLFRNKVIYHGSNKQPKRKNLLPIPPEPGSLHGVYKIAEYKGQC